MKKQIRRFTACLLVGVMLLLQGCAGKEGTSAEESSQAGTAQGADAAAEKETESGERTMGRYLEEEITLPEDIDYVDSPRVFLKKLDTGELALIEQKTGMYLSSDQGESWSRKETPWLNELREVYLLDLTIAPNGAVAVSYMLPSDETKESEDAGLQTANLYVSPDGNETQLESPDKNNYIHRFAFGKDSRLYGYTMGGNVYEMDPTGGGDKLLFETEGLSDFVCFTDQYMIDLTSRGVLYYDLENGLLVDADQVLQTYIEENVGSDIGSYSDAYCVVMAEGEEENVLYFACEDGLYRHVIGGTAVEQIMEGSLSSLGDPMMLLAGMVVLPDNEFAILYTNGKMYRYVYNPDIPTVPEEQISIYGLTESYAIRQAVSLFQKQHPEVYVRYEIGMSSESGMTSEDAIKNLNTKMMSGSGPDLLVLDGLPRVSYQEKGVLTDLSEVVGEMTGDEELFSNLVDACRVDGKLWYLPLRFRLPLLVGETEKIQGVTDLTTLADTVEKLREEHPTGALTGLMVEEKALRMLAMNSSGAWLDKKTGALDEGKLQEFLTQAKRIYQAEIEGLDEAELEEYAVRYISSINWSGAKEYFGSADSAAMNIAMKEQVFGMGMTNMMDGDFNTISTLANQEENLDYGVWQGQVQDGFIPKVMIGVSSASKEKELVWTFFHFLYGRELQDIETAAGFPMNRVSFEGLKVNPRSEDMSLSIGTSGPDGTSFSLDIKWVTEEDFAKIKEMVENAKNVCTGDERVEEVVYEIGGKALKGSVSVEDAVKEIGKKVGIYLAE